MVFQKYSFDNIEVNALVITLGLYAFDHSFPKVSHETHMAAPKSICAIGPEGISRTSGISNMLSPP